MCPDLQILGTVSSSGPRAFQPLERLAGEDDIFTVAEKSTEIQLLSNDSANRWLNVCLCRGDYVNRQIDAISDEFSETLVIRLRPAARSLASFWHRRVWAGVRPPSRFGNSERPVSAGDRCHMTLSASESLGSSRAPVIACLLVCYVAGIIGNKIT
jgi:hypothetical protein